MYARRIRRIQLAQLTAVSEYAFFERWGTWLSVKEQNNPGYWQEVKEVALL